MDEQFFTKNDAISWPTICIPESKTNKRKSLEYFENDRIFISGLSYPLELTMREKIKVINIR